MTELFRSNTYQSMYPDEYMLEAFGKLNPNVHERNTYFFDLWCKRRPNRYKVNTSDKNAIKQCLKSTGLKDLWDFQLRGNEIRFEHPEDLAMFKLCWRKANG